MQKRGLAATFRATGQTGVFISGRGVAIDAVVADFIAGAVEWIAPAADPDHWDVIEGQGSLFHPSFSGVTLGLLHGSQPDAFVVCHEPTRRTMRGVDTPIPSIEDVIEATVMLGRLTNPAIRCVGIAVNTGVKENGVGYSHKLKQFVAGEKDHESRVAFLKYISLLLPALHEDWHKVVFFDASLPP